MRRQFPEALGASSHLPALPKKMGAPEKAITADPPTSTFPDSRASTGNAATVHTLASLSSRDLVCPGHNKHPQVLSGRAHDHGPAGLEHSGYRHHALPGSVLGAGKA